MSKKTHKPKPSKSRPKPKDTGKLFKTLSLKYKEEVVLSWHCSGGVVCGERLTLKDLAVRIELSEHMIEKLIESIKSSFIKQFQTQKNIREQVFILAGTLMEQLREDRARSTLHNDQLDQQIRKTQELIGHVENFSEGTWTEYTRKQKEMAALKHHMRALNAFKAEAMRIHLETTKSLSGFLSLFAGKGRLPLEDIPDSDGAIQFLDYMGAIRVIESKSELAVLPKQGLSSGGNRNPNVGFEELESQRK